MVSKLLFLILIFFLSASVNTNDHCDKYAVIRSQKSGLVLDASEYKVKLQHYTGFPAQLWKLETPCGGKVIIVNKGNGKALDVQGGAVSGNNLITYGKHGGGNQQWYINYDGTIVNAGEEIAVDICRSNYSAGNQIIASNRHGGANQKFVIQYY